MDDVAEHDLIDVLARQPRPLAARATVAPSSVGGMSRRLRPNEPMALRIAEAMTTSVME
jgi:hypothetical protein